jgi:large subunit ribosomal protein L15
MRLHDLRPPKGARRERRRVGRGLGSGRGTTAGKGTKGQKARSGGAKPPYFEGGQLPLVRRLPYRRGFKNPFRVSFTAVNLRQLADWPAQAEVTAETLVAHGLVHPGERPIKLLADGDITVPLRVRLDRVSAAARAKIEAAGGTVEELLPRKEKQRQPRSAVTAQE